MPGMANKPTVKCFLNVVFGVLNFPALIWSDKLVPCELERADGFLFNG